MRSYTPAEAEFLTGIPTDKFRDWRRRGLLDGFGVYPLPMGGWTSDPNHPDLPASKRWVYPLGDIVCLSIVSELGKFGIDLKFNFEIAKHAGPFVYGWTFPSESKKHLNLRKSRFMAAYPSGHGLETLPGAEVQAVLLEDLNRIIEYSRGPAIVLDLIHLASTLPQRVRAEILQDL